MTVRIWWHLGACIGRHKKVLGVLKTLRYSHDEKCNPGLLVCQKHFNVSFWAEF